MAKIRYTPADDSTCGWFHLSQPRVARPSHSGVRSARWVVLGAGFTGLAAARQLALNFPDDEVVLIEAQEVGYGASGRNAGFAIDLPHDIGAEDYIGDIKTAKISMALNLTGQHILKDLVEKHRIDCQFRMCGKYQAAIEDRGISVLDAYRRGLDKLGQEYEMIEEKDLPDHIGTHFYRKALFTPGTALIQPAALVKGLADSLPANVTLYENTPITEVEYGDKTILTHNNGRIVADKLLLTNNAFAMSFGFLKGRMLPIFTYGSLTRQLTEDEQERLGGKPYWGVIPAIRSALPCAGQQTTACWCVTASASMPMDAATRNTWSGLASDTRIRLSADFPCSPMSISSTPGAGRWRCRVTTWRTSGNWPTTSTEHCAAMAWA